MGRQADDGDWGLDMLEGPLSKVLSLSLFFISPTEGERMTLLTCLYNNIFFFFSSFLLSTHIHA